MKAIFWILALSLTAQHSFADDLQTLIKQNIEEVKKSYGKHNQEQPAQLWIQVRSDEQKKLFQNITDWLKPLGLITIQPVELVKDGPQKTQLRFFSSADKQQAEALSKKLKEFFPELELQNLSAQYVGKGWLQPGHYELWLAPDVKNSIPPVSSPPVNSVPVAPVTQ